MADVTLRPVDASNLDAVLALDVEDDQWHLIASNVKSMAQAAVDDRLVPVAAYDGRWRGMDRPDEPPVGFRLLEYAGGTGFIQRLMVDRNSQRRGYGFALLVAVVRRLERDPRVELVGISHRRENLAMAMLTHKAGFVAWQTPWTDSDPGEVYLRLPVQAEDQSKK